MRSLDDIVVSGSVVIVRVDFNVPLGDEDASGLRAITDTGRIEAALPTLDFLRDQGAQLLIVAHLGRPKGAVDPNLSLAPVAAALADFLGAPVDLARTIVEAKEMLERGEEVVVLENIRFDARETSKDATERKALAQDLAAVGEVFVSEGFGVVHREQASVTDIARLLPNAAGRLVHKEAEIFSQLLGDPARPYVVVLGGSKVSDKLAVIGN